MPQQQSRAEIEAQKEYFQRANGPVIGGRPSLNSDPNRLLKEYQALGRIPAHYESWEQINGEFSDLIQQGFKEDAARLKLGLTYRTPTGQYIITKYDRYGEGNYINARNINEDLHPEAEAELLRTRGPQYVEEVRNKGMHDWGDKKSKTPDVMAPTAQQDVVAARDRMTANIGRTHPRDSAAQLHRGHGFSASQSSAGPHRSNLQPEWGPFNTQGHAGVPGNPRYHPDTMHDMNLPPTMEAGIYYDQLDKEGLNLLPYDQREAGDFMAADEWQVVKGKGPGVQGNYDITTAPEPAQYPAESILPRAEERLRAGMSPAQRQAAADAQSSLLDTTDATALSGPVRTSQMSAEDLNAIKPPANATTQRLDQAAAARQRLGIPDNNPTPIPTSRTSTKVKVTPTTTVVLPKPPDAPKPSRIPLVGKTPKRLPNIDIKGGTAGALAGMGLVYLMGESPSEAAAGNIPILSDIESTNTGVAERVGGQIFVDPTTNRLRPTTPSQVGMGLAYLNGKPIAVPYGSVAGTKSTGQMAKEVAQHVVSTNTKRVQQAAAPVVRAAAPVVRAAANAAPPVPKPIAHAMALLNQGWKFIQGGR